MHPTNYHLIGLMSGTSGDGLDIAFVHFEWKGRWVFRIDRTETVSFPANLGKKLSEAHLLSGLEICKLDVDFGQWMGRQVKTFCEKHQLEPDAVASHGHTVFHQPENRLSLQIGNGWALHQTSGYKVINDFRMLDVQLGGQGAPLVPIGDQLLFPEVDFCINLGGISNISMEKDGQRIAFDCSPFNLLLNAEAQKLGKSYDNEGKIAQSGEVNLTLFERLNEIPFYSKNQAKSLGREDMEQVFTPLIRESGLSPADALSTLVEHFAFQIGGVIRTFSTKKTPSILLTGGGAYNAYFIQRLDHYLRKSWKRVETDSELIEFKEALIFAFLGLLRLRGENNCLASVTGSSRDNCGGTIYG
ncbi:anhydro-N-acetylmuramic acid kinase [Algoriphagus litoralis]|uniref:anhydro-N-acetylmuramic acid kinase n=1 Tax=Algoriphagus litoralis TaxID=2202829 RepID=UPI000DB9AF8D|nr:anhydro-N-acetylmuramic acid kinase [Algoriphagus litoralis]